MDWTRAMNCCEAREDPPPARGVGDAVSPSGVNQVAAAAAPAAADGDVELDDSGGGEIAVEMRCWTDVLALVGLGVEVVLIRRDDGDDGGDDDGVDAAISYGGGMEVSCSCCIIPAANTRCVPMRSN